MKNLSVRLVSKLSGFSSHLEKGADVFFSLVGMLVVFTPTANFSGQMPTPVDLVMDALS